MNERMLISIRWYVSNKQWKEIARTHTYTYTYTSRIGSLLVGTRKKDHFDTFLSPRSFGIVAMNDDRCVLTSLMCPLAEEKHCAMCVHLSVVVGDSIERIWWIFDCARMHVDHSVVYPHLHTHIDMMRKISAVWSRARRSMNENKRRFPQCAEHQQMTLQWIDQAQPKADKGKKRKKDRFYCFLHWFNQFILVLSLSLFNYAVPQSKHRNHLIQRRTVQTNGTRQTFLIVSSDQRWLHANVVF